jgi:hypothetical protein
MKRLVAIALLTSIIALSGCTSNEIEILSTNYRAQYNDMYIVSEPLLIDSFEQWVEFLENHPEKLTNEDNLEWHLDELFFDERVIYAYISQESSGSNRFEAEKAEVSDNILKLYMTRTIPETHTDDLAIRICLFGIRRVDIQNTRTVEAIIEVKR